MQCLVDEGNRLIAFESERFVVHARVAVFLCSWPPTQADRMVYATFLKV
jgi:hypothetical protein